MNDNQRYQSKKYVPDNQLHRWILGLLPISVLWMRIPEDLALMEQVPARSCDGKFMMLVDRHD